MIDVADLRIGLDEPTDLVIGAEVVARDSMQGVALLDADVPRFPAILIRRLACNVRGAISG